MLKYCKDKWAENENKLREVIERTDVKERQRWTYQDLLTLIIENVLNPGMQPEHLHYKGFKPDAGSPWQTKVTEIDDGDYQGTLIFAIHMNSYQPDAHEYMFTFVEYGSCSGCDTLQGIQSEDFLANCRKMAIDDYMTLCRHMVSNFKHPFECGFITFEEAEV